MLEIPDTGTRKQALGFGDRNSAIGCRLGSFMFRLVFRDQLFKYLYCMYEGIGYRVPVTDDECSYQTCSVHIQHDELQIKMASRYELSSYLPGTSLPHPPQRQPNVQNPQPRFPTQASHIFTPYLDLNDTFTRTCIMRAK
jgi:hypothetical protein